MQIRRWGHLATFRTVNSDFPFCGVGNTERETDVWKNPCQCRTCICCRDTGSPPTSLFMYSIYTIKASSACLLPAYFNMVEPVLFFLLYFVYLFLIFFSHGTFNMLASQCRPEPYFKRQVSLKYLRLGKFGVSDLSLMLLHDTQLNFLVGKVAFKLVMLDIWTGTYQVMC